MQSNHRPPRSAVARLAGLALTLAVIALVTLFAPLEQTLGSGMRLVYFHGAWVWAGMITFGLAALAGLAGLLLDGGWPGWSLALGRSGLFFWLTYLPMSLWVMQIFWGGLFLDEPRWRIPFAFGVVAVLLQAGLALLGSARLAALGNLVFGAALLWSLGRAEAVLHPDSPVFTSNSLRIKVFFVMLVALSLLFSAQLAVWLEKSRP
jgi:hypothetical protein